MIQEARGYCFKKKISDEVLVMSLSLSKSPYGNNVSLGKVIQVMVI